MTEPESQVSLRARHFQALCDLDAAGRAAGLAELAVHDAALAAEVARLLTLDDEAEGPIEGLRGEIAAAAGRQLLADQMPEAAELAPPERLGVWKLGEKLGAGGMGEVWAAERIEGGFGQRAAIKLVRSGMSSREIVARFRVERELLARLQHAAIARLLDGGVAPDGRPWFAMERIDGVPITDYARDRALPLNDRLRLIAKVARAVDAAHRSLVLHRDLKPSNILVTAGGEPKLLDFGLAKLLEPDSDPRLTRTDMRALTPAYAAPEQVLGEPVTIATDVYTLGVLLYELTTGELPHARRAPTSEGLADEVSRETIERPSSRVKRSSGLSPAAAAIAASPATVVSAERSTGATIAGVSRARLAHRLKGDLDTIVLTALQREPERRYATAAALADDLERFLAGRPVAAQPDTVAYRARKFVSRHRVAVLAAVVVLLALVAGVSAALWQARATRLESERTGRVRDFLASIFGSLDPDLGPGRDASAATLLAAGAARIEAELGDEPGIAAELYAALGRAWLALDRYDEAERLARRSHDLATTSSGPRSIRAAASLALRGEIATAQEDLRGGEELLRQALTLLDSAAPGSSDELEAARAAAALGRNLNSQERHGEALAFSEQAQEVLARRLGAADREAIRALITQSEALRGGARPAEASRRIENARALLAATPRVHPVTRALLDLERAHVEVHLRHPSEALAAAELALASLDATLGPSSAASATALQARSLARIQGGDFDGARADSERAIAILRALDPNHPLLIRMRLDLALIAEHRGQTDEGIAQRRELLAATVQRTGRESAEVRMQRSLLGAVLRSAERWAEAEVELREVLRLEELGSESALVHAGNSTRFDLAIVLVRTGRPAEAVTLLRETLARMTALGEGVAKYERALVRLQLAQALLAVGDPASLVEARAMAEASAELTQGASESSSSHDVFPEYVLARIDLAEGKLDAARRRFEASLAIWRRNGRESSRAAGVCRLQLGETLLRLGESDLAEESLREAYELLFRRAGANDEATRRAKELLDGLAASRAGRQPRG
jgi:eukaryotic-like serine/threonine-protein kinase